MKKVSKVKKSGKGFCSPFSKSVKEREQILLFLKAQYRVLQSHRYLLPFVLTAEPTEETAEIIRLFKENPKKSF